MAIINGTTGDDSLFGNINEDDLIHGLEGADEIFGRSGNDEIHGDAGNDTLWGEGGNDQLFGGDGNDILRGGDGNDTLDGGTGSGSIDGDAGDDLIFARGGGMFIEGDDGNDTVRVYSSGDNALYGGTGTDTLIFDFTTAAQGASVNLTFIGSGSNGTITHFNGGSTGQIEGFETLHSTILGSAFADRFTIYAAYATALSFHMGAGNDEVTSGAGADTIDVGDGNDFVNAGAGNDTVYGGLGNDLLRGGDGNDTLYGGGGADDLEGQAGDDQLFVTGNAGGDIDGGTGTDWLTLSFASATFGATLNLTNLWIGGGGTLNGGLILQVERLSTDALVGSAFNDTLTIGAGYAYGITLEGGAGDDTLTGGGGNDALYGGDGMDTLNGLGGSDTLYGGAGNDHYIVSSALTSVAENAGEGIDTVHTSVDYTLGANVEHLIVTTSGALVAHGNALNNSITGGAGNNELYGGDGDDTILGGGGQDYLYGEAGNDTLNGGDGSDLLAGGDGNNTLVGGDGNDSIVLEGSGVNHADGGAGFYDVLRIQVTGTTGNNVTLSGLWSGGTGQVNGGTVQGFELLGTGFVFGTAFNDNYQFGHTYIHADGVTGIKYQSNGGNDYIEGTAGVDVMVGGSGQDRFVGYGGADELRGGDGDDLLSGGAGDDLMVGGHGDDSYYIQDAGDVIDESDGSGLDSVVLTVSMNYTLGANIEYGRFVNNSVTGTLTGNSLNNLLIGANAGDAPNGTLIGAEGADVLQYGQTMRGGIGNDHYYLVNGVGTSGDIIELADEGYDTVSFFRSSYTLHDNVEEAIGGWEGGVQITGNTLDNRITSNSGAFADVLHGMDGNDELILGVSALNGQAHGGNGNDVLRGGLESDNLFGDAGDDTLIGGVGADVIDGGGGSDTVNYSGSNAAVTVRLNTALSTGGHAQGDTLTSTENAIGSAFNDALTGTGGVNRLEGGTGDDEMRGAGGDDTLLGGTGQDTAIFSGNRSAYVITNTLPGVFTVNGPDGLDVLIGVEFARFADETVTLVSLLSGTPGNDTINGTEGADQIRAQGGNDVLYGHDGDDVLRGGAGDDLLYGGAGSDTVDYGDAASAVTVYLTTTTYAATGGSGIDLWSSIENVIGSDFNDTLAGDAQANSLRGGNGTDTLLGRAGDDVLMGEGGNDVMRGGDGNDLLNGGTGDDTVDYSDATSGVNVTLYQRTGQNTGGGGTDTLFSVSGLIGSAFGDDIVATSGNNVLDLGGGDDVAVLFAGNDTAWGGAGDDTFTGGTGNDTLWGGNDADLLKGNEDNDVLNGEDGADVLKGGSGDDSINGGNGDDNIQGEAGIDTLTGGAGADRFVFSDGDLGGNVASRERIMDFNAAEGDQINQRNIDANVNLAGDQNFTKVGAFTNVAGQYVWEQHVGFGIALFDTNGDGTADLAMRVDGSTDGIAGWIL